MDKLRRKEICVTDLFHYLFYFFVVSWTIGFIRKICVDDEKKRSNLFWWILNWDDDDIVQ